MSRSEHVVVDDAGEDDGTEKKKKGVQDKASEYALVAATAGKDDGTEEKTNKKKRRIDIICTNKPFDFLLSRLVFVFEIKNGNMAFIIYPVRAEYLGAQRLPMMILNGLVGRDTYRMKKDNGEKIYRKLDSCLVIPPPKGKKAKAIIKFLGDAFIGAVPEVTYGLRFILLSILRIDLHRVNFEISELVDLPLSSVGHSNGALFQVLSGSYFSNKLPKLGPLVSQMMPMVEASSVSSMADCEEDCT
nr:hypothetical protein [Tanacetum cinerariifolium]